MFDKNSILIGIAIGILLPFIGLAIMLEIFDVFEVPFRRRTSALLAICLNLLPFQIFNRKRQEATMRGIILGTMILGAAWIFWYGGKFLGF